MKGVDFAPLGVANPDPGPDWRRVRRVELAARLGAASEVSSTHRASLVPRRGLARRPAPLRPKDHLFNLRPEGSSSVWQTQVRRQSASPLTRSSLVTGLTMRIRASSVRFAASLSCATTVGTPNNFWATDHSWFVYTDWDLWATKVSGPLTLIAALEADTELVTTLWPDPEMKQSSSKAAPQKP